VTLATGTLVAKIKHREFPVLSHHGNIDRQAARAARAVVFNNIDGVLLPPLQHRFRLVETIRQIAPH
tara:strand:- start:3914 stop:4114 length:201 start_codon:yes stop_codon:yes gene_type:complete